MLRATGSIGPSSGQVDDMRLKLGEIHTRVRYLIAMGGMISERLRHLPRSAPISMLTPFPTVGLPGKSCTSVYAPALITSITLGAKSKVFRKLVSVWPDWKVSFCMIAARYSRFVGGPHIIERDSRRSMPLIAASRVFGMVHHLR